MQYNLRLYPFYYAFSAFLAWMPVFFLYFNSYLDLSDVLLLESIYYIVVVALEIPSGYLSDVVGRKRTLLIGAFFLCLAILFYLVGRSFAMLVVGQLFFAGHMSFVSGTNTVFYFESLKADGRDQEYGDREASVTKWSLISAGIAALLGGWAASYDLSYAFIVSLLGAVPALIIAFLFVEPKKTDREEASLNALKQMIACLSYLRKPPLNWIFVFFVLMFTMVHVPYEFYQPYLKLLEFSGQLTFSSAPMMSGLLLSLSLFVSAFAASKSIDWKNKLGLKKYLLLMLFMMITIVALMSSFLHTFLIVIILFRSFSWSAVRPPINEAITPRIAAGQRATFHSMLSLVSRMSFFALLLLLSLITPSHQETDWANLSNILRICLGIGVFFSIPLLIVMFRKEFK